MPGCKLLFFYFLQYRGFINLRHWKAFSISKYLLKKTFSLFPKFIPGPTVYETTNVCLSINLPLLRGQTTYKCKPS